MTRRHTIGDRRIFFDIESGGLHPNSHPVTQLGAAVLDANFREIASFEVKLKFNEKECDPAALKKNGYDPGLWALHAVEPLTAMERFCYFLREHATLPMFSQRKQTTYHVAQLFAHNAKFGAAFLWRLHALLKEQEPGLFLPASRRVVCTLQRAYALFDEICTLSPPPDYQLGTLCAYFDVPYSTNEAHDALYDARAAAGLYQAMRAVMSPQKQATIAA